MSVRDLILFIGTDRLIALTLELHNMPTGAGNLAKISLFRIQSRVSV